MIFTISQYLSDELAKQGWQTEIVIHLTGSIDYVQIR